MKLPTFNLLSYPDSCIPFGSRWTPGSGITSPNQNYLLIFQTDGNLCLYQLSNKLVKDSDIRYKWGTGSGLSGAMYCSFLSDGNIAILGPVHGRPGTLWEKGSSPTPPFFLVYFQLQDDGNFVLYKKSADWATYTQAQSE